MKRVKTFNIFAAVINLTISILLFLVAVSPLYVFSGSVRGFVSLTGYEVSWFEEKASFPILETISRLSVFIFIASGAGVALSTLGLMRSKSLLVSGALYGSAAGLLAAYVGIGGLMNLLNTWLKNALSVKNQVETSAGLIVFPELVAEPTIYVEVARSPILPFIPLASIALTLCNLWVYIVEESRQPLKTNHQPPPRRLLPKLIRIVRGVGKHKPEAFATLLVLLLASSTLFLVHAGVYIYYPTDVSIQPVPPLIVMELPSYTVTCTALTRTVRGALTFTDFEPNQYGGWANLGGSWSPASGAGFKGYALRGSDNNGGPGSASYYYWATSVSSYTSLWISSKVRLETGATDTYRGVAMLSSTLAYVYLVSVRAGASAGTGVLEVRSFTGGWRTESSTTFTGYTRDSWYILVVKYDIPYSRITITAEVYDLQGNMLASTSASPPTARSFRPAYVGVGVDGTTANFDDFVVSTVDPKTVGFAGLSNMVVEVWDNLNNLVASASGSGQVSLSIVRDVVVGTGVDGSIIFKYPNGIACGIYRVPDNIVGGDTYTLHTSGVTVSIGSGGTSALVSSRVSASSSFISGFTALRIANYDTKPYYVKLTLILEKSFLDDVYMNVTVHLQGGYTSQPIAIVGGSALSLETEWLLVPVGSYNNLVYVSAYMPGSGRGANAVFELEIRPVSVDSAVRAIYPLSIQVQS